MVDETHDPELRSWVASANEAGDFPIQNLPLAAFLYQQQPHAGVGIGDFVLDLRPWIEGTDLSAFFKLSAADRTSLRHLLSRALREDMPQKLLYPQSECQFLLPCVIGDYTDFYASIHHARNIGALFRPDNPLLPNYRHVPIAYHGRASSIVVSGTPVQRPCGQLGEGLFGPTNELDYEVELAVFVGPGNSMGQPILIGEAEAHLAGFCLLNDWSARDIQRWEYQPLGPFLSKSFATSVSPWIVTMDALAPFRVPARREGRVELPYLRTTEGAFDICVEVFLNGSKRLSHASFGDMYWTFAQMIAHHTSNGCALRPGDLIGSGTISGPNQENRGCLLELGLPLLQDGDEITLRACCRREGFRRIGFGECTGKILSAHH